MVVVEFLFLDECEVFESDDSARFDDLYDGMLTGRARCEGYLAALDEEDACQMFRHRVHEVLLLKQTRYQTVTDPGDE